MKIKAEAPKIVDTIRKINSLVSGSDKITLTASSDEVWILKQSSNLDNVKAALRLWGVSVKKKGSVAVSADVLSGACKQRKEVVLERQENELVVSSGRYNTKCPIMEKEKIKFPDPKETTKLSKYFTASLALGLEKVMLKDHLKSADDLTVSVCSNAKRTVVFCGDTFHAAFYEAKGFGDLEFTLSSEHAKTLSELFLENRKMTLAVSNSQFCLKDKNMELVWPILSPRIPLEKFEMIFKEPSRLAEVYGIGMRAILINFSSLYEQDSRLEIGVEKEKLNLSVSSSRGSSTETIKYGGGLKKANIFFHPHMFSEIINLLPQTFKANFNEKNGYFETGLIKGKIKYLLVASAT